MVGMSFSGTNKLLFFVHDGSPSWTKKFLSAVFRFIIHLNPYFFHYIMSRKLLAKVKTQFNARCDASRCYHALLRNDSLVQNLLAIFLEQRKGVGVGGGL